MLFEVICASPELPVVALASPELPVVALASPELPVVDVLGRQPNVAPAVLVAAEVAHPHVIASVGQYERCGTQSQKTTSQFLSFLILLLSTWKEETSQFPSMLKGVG